MSLLLWSCDGRSSTTDLVGPGDVRCTLALSRESAAVGPERETGTITVSAARDCTWSASSDVGWIAITGGASGQGNGRVDYVVAGNPAPVERRGGLVVGEQRVEIAQEGAPCTFALNGTHGAVGAAGGTVTVSVDAFPGCSWTATSGEHWIAVSEGAESEGPGAVAMQVAPNAGGPRTGTVTVAGQPYAVAQEASCTFTVGLTPSHIPAEGGWIGVTVDTQPWCRWDLVSHVTWISVAEIGRTGSGSATFSVAMNVGALRSGSVTVAGRVHTITQDAATGAVGTASQPVASEGGSRTVTD